MNNRDLFAIYFVTFAIAMVIVFRLADDPKGNGLTSAAAVIGSLIVSIGWMLTTLITNRNNQRERTIQTITESKDQNEVRWKIINENIPGRDTTLPLPGEYPLCFPKEHAVYDAIDALLNDFDFIALGVRKGVYDRHMLQSALDNDFRDLYKTSARYIRYVQRSLGDGDVWREFEELAERWGTSRSVTPRWLQLKRAIKLAARLSLLFVRGSIAQLLRVR